MQTLEKDMNIIFSKLDQNKDGRVSYSEFISKI